MLSSNNSYGSLLVFNTGHSKKKLKSFFYFLFFLFIFHPFAFFLSSFPLQGTSITTLTVVINPEKEKMITLNVIFHCMRFFDRQRPKKKKKCYFDVPLARIYLVNL